MNVSELFRELFRKCVLNRATEISILLLRFFLRNSNSSEQHFKHCLTFLSPESKFSTNVTGICYAIIKCPLSQKHKSKLIILKNRPSFSILSFKLDLFVEKAFLIKLSYSNTFPLLLLLWLELFFLFIVSFINFAFKHIKVSLLYDCLLIIITNMSDLWMNILIRDTQHPHPKEVRVLLIHLPR